MGAGSSKKKKALAVAKGASLQKPQPPKPLTAVSEGEEQAWSSVHLEEDKDDDLPKPPKKNRAPSRETRQQSPKTSPISTESKSAMSTSTSEPPTRIESAVSLEEKEEYPTSGNSGMVEETVPQESSYQSEPQQESYTEPQTFAADTTAVVEEEQTKVEEPPPREPTPDPQQEGGYLMFSTVSDGTLYLQYSHSKVEGAIAYFKPNKIVPAFKYRQSHGKVELIRRLQNNKQGYYEGYCDFFKAAKEFDADVLILQNTARVYYQPEGSKVVEAPMNKFFSIQVSKIAVIPPINASFEGVQNMHPDQFISTGNKYGKAVKF